MNNTSFQNTSPPAPNVNLTLGQLTKWLSIDFLSSVGLPICTGNANLVVKRIHTDSRTIRTGDLFVALQGDAFDGHDFLGEIQAAGAFALVAHSKRSEKQSVIKNAIWVADTKIALGQLAKQWRLQMPKNFPLIAVTGSNGKTTVTQMLASILRAHCEHQPELALATQGNFNNDIGVPLTLLRLQPPVLGQSPSLPSLISAHRIAVVELGMNHIGEIAHIADLAQPTVAMVNNAQREHLEFMGSIDAVAVENAACFETLSHQGTAVFPWGDVYTPLWWQMVEDINHKNTTPAVTDSNNEIQSLDAIKINTFFDAKPSQIQAFEALMAKEPSAKNVPTVFTKNAVWDASKNAWALQVHSPLGSLFFDLHTAGRHNVHNALAAVTCALAAGVGIGAIEVGLNGFQSVKGRSQTSRLILPLDLDCVTNNNTKHALVLTLVDDTYNANPDSMQAAIDVLASLPQPSLLIMGDMGEVGDDGIRFHAEAGQYAQHQKITHLLALGELCKHAVTQHHNANHHTDMDGLQQAVWGVLQKSGTHNSLYKVEPIRSILIKGSRFMQMEKVVAFLQSKQ